MRAAGGEELVIGMLHLDHRRAILGMRPVSKALLDVIGFDVLDARALVPGESQILALALEVVFDMTVGAYHRAHLLAREGAPVPALFPERFLQRWVGNHQFHRLRVMAVGAADGIPDPRAKILEQRLIVGFHAHRIPQARVIRTLAGVAGAGGGLVDALALAHVHDRVHMPAVLGVHLGKAVTGEEDLQVGVLDGLFNWIRTAVLGARVVFSGLQQCGELVGEILTPDGAVGLHLGHLHHRRHAADGRLLLLHHQQRANQDASQDNDDAGQDQGEGEFLHHSFLMVRSAITGGVLIGEDRDAPFPMRDRTVACETVAARVHLTVGDIGYGGLVAADAVGLNDSVSGLLGAQRVGDLIKREHGHMPHARGHLAPIFGDQRVRGVAVVANGELAVAGVEPALIHRVHHMAVVACGGVVSQISGEVGHVHQRAQRRRQRGQPGEEGDFPLVSHGNTKIVPG